jgi:hypothetical protein
MIELFTRKCITVSKPASKSYLSMDGMTPILLADIERAVRRNWAMDTCPPEGRSQWTLGNPAFGQCGATAMVVNDLLGGDVVRGEVLVDGQHDDYHWWNRLVSGVEIDLTREQFGPQHEISAGVAVIRTPVSDWSRLREEYQLLRSRVFRDLAIGTVDLDDT